MSVAAKPAAPYAGAIDIAAYWAAALAQRPREMAEFFAPEALVRWPNTNECFTAAEFIRANCEYPGRWEGEIERTEAMGPLLVTVVRVFDPGRTVSFHVTSFFRVKEGRIAALEEYWGDDGPPPAWRQALHLGRPIR